MNSLSNTRCKDIELEKIVIKSSTVFFCLQIQVNICDELLQQ